MRDMDSGIFLNDDVQYDTRCALLDSVYDSEIIDCVNKWEPTSRANDIIVCPTDEPLYLSSLNLSAYFPANFKILENI